VVVSWFKVWWWVIEMDLVLVVVGTVDSVDKIQKMMTIY